MFCDSTACQRIGMTASTKSSHILMKARNTTHSLTNCVKRRSGWKDFCTETSFPPQTRNNPYSITTSIQGLSLSRSETNKREDARIGKSI